VSEAWFYARHELRQHWVSYVGLALVVGIVAGLVIALVAGGRRTDTAYDRFLQAQRAYDVAVINYPSDGTAVFDLDEIAALPDVEDSAAGPFNYVPLGAGVPALGSDDGRIGTAINRFELVDGRLMRPDRIDEVVVGFDLAERFGLHPGSRIPAIPPEFRPGRPGFEALPPSEREGISRTLERLPDGYRVVGIVASPGEFPPQPRNAQCCVHWSQAYGEDGGGESEILYVRLRHGSDGVAEFRRQLLARAQGKPLQLYVQRDQARTVERSIHAQAVGLWLLAAITGIVALPIVGQLLARQTFLQTDDFQTLRAIGYTTGQRFLIAWSRALTVAVSGGMLAVVLAVVLSPIFPIGIARRAEPADGISIDVAVLGFGFLVTAGILALVGAVPAWLSARAVARPRDQESGRRGSISERLRSLPGPVPMAMGVRLAAERGRGGTAVPVGSSLLALTLGIVALIAALTFGASLDHLVSTPRLYGQSWDDAASNFNSDPPLARTLAPLIQDRQEVRAAAAGLGPLQIDLDATRVDVIGMTSVKRSLRPPIIDGRAPSGATEIALGAATMRELHVGVGDDVRVVRPDGARQRLRVVGQAVFPAVSERLQLGRGGLMTLGGLVRLTGDGQDPAHADLYFRYARNADRSALRRDLVDGLCHAHAGCFVNFDNQEGVTSQAYGKPDDIVNFGRVRQTPLVIGAVLAAFAMAALAHVLVSAVRRRGQVLAILKVLGFTRRQLVATVLVQSSTLVLIALAIGIPLGIVAGRVLWGFEADGLGILSEPVVGVVAVAGVALLALVIGNAVALVPARVAASTPAAAALRRD
jgi:ABC-type lipoprotein release transport system permease subunit